MPIIHLPNPLRPYVLGQSEVCVEGATVRAAMEDLMIRFPNFRTHIYKEDGSLRAFVNLFLASQNIRDMQGLDTPLNPNDILTLVPSIAGG